MARTWAWVGLAAALAAAGVPAARAQQGEADWRTVANGDYVLALAPVPGAPDRLLAGTEGGGLVRWDLASGSHEQLLFPNTPGLAGNDVRDIAFDAAGEAWLAVPGGGVTHLAAAGARRFRAEEGLPAALDLTSIAVDGEGTVWVGTREDGLARLAPDAVRWEAVTADPEDPEAGLGGNQVADLAVSPDGRSLYVAHGRSGKADHPALSVLDVATGAWRRVAANLPGSSDTEGAPSDQIMALAFDGAGTLWAASWAKGVLAYDGQAWRQFGEADGVCGRNVWAVAAGEREVWVACGEDLTTAVERGAGAARWDGAAWTPVTTAEGLPTNDVLALAVGGEGRAWLGTRATSGPGQGIVPVADGKPGAPLLTGPGSIPVNDLTALVFQPDGTAWVGTRGLGLLRYDGSGWRRFSRADTPGLAGDTVTALALAPDGRTLLVGTTQAVVENGAYVDGGLSVLDLGTGDWRAIRASEDGLPANEVASLAVDGAGRVWVGLGAVQGRAGGGANSQAGKGLAVWDPATDTWRVVTRESSAGGLPGDTVAGLAVAGDAVWAAASYGQDENSNRVGGGLGRLLAGAWQPWVDGAAGFQTYAEAEGGVTGDVRAVLLDAGTTWAGTWDLADVNALTSRWPRVDAVVNRSLAPQPSPPGQEAAFWRADSFKGAGWVSALARDTVGEGRVWAATSRGHTMEFSPTGAAWLDGPPGGAWFHEGEAWTNVNPLNSGLAAWGLTALGVQPSTGDLWLATENGGLSILAGGAPVAAATPCADCPAPSLDPSPLAGAPTSWALAGLAGLALLGVLAAWWLRRRRPGSADGGTGTGADGAG